MTDTPTPFTHLGPERAIKAKRLKLSPVSPGDLSTLAELGLIEMRNDMPVLTNAGHAVLD
jgi:hypothetical protein